MTPTRVLRRRTAGWRTPDNTVIVTRPSRFGNPFTFAMAYEFGYAKHGDTETARAATVGAFEDWICGNTDMWQSDKGNQTRNRLIAGLPELRGKNLACYCPLGAPCHADILLRLAADPVFTAPGFTSYHIDPNCNALESARLTVRGGAMRVTTTQTALDTSRPPCIVCADDPKAAEWTVTTANLGQLWELIEPSKFFVEFPADTDKPVTTGLTIRPHKGLPKQYATFGDRITVSRGRYTVHPATQEQQR